MSFSKLFQHSNSSLYSLRGSVLDCSIEFSRENIIYLNTGLKSTTLCFQSELNTTKELELNGAMHHEVQTTSSKSDAALQCFAESQRFAQSSLAALRANKTQTTAINNKHILYNVAIENLDIFGEAKLVLPKSLSIIRKRKLVWSELKKVWHSSKNRVRGFLFNSVKGGFAVAIAGHIAFLPKSLLIKRYGQGKFRFFSIVNMNPSFQNIVIKELASTAEEKPLRSNLSKVNDRVNNVGNFVDLLKKKKNPHIVSFRRT